MSTSEITRRRLLVHGGVAVGGAALLGACGSSGGSHSTTDTGKIGQTIAGGGTPVRGGTLRVAMNTGGSAETIDPAIVSAYVDVMRGWQLYDPLFTLSSDVKTVPALAVSGESNKNATVWTLKLRDGVTWHDGKPFTADDVVYAFRGWAKPSNFGHAALVGAVDFARVRKVDRLTVEVPMVVPVANFPSYLASPNLLVPQDGSTPASFKTHPIGTGPFKFESFQPARRSVFVANENYWGDRPYVERLVVDSSFTDEAARLNALLSGTVDVLAQLPYLEAANQRKNSAIKVISSPGLVSYQVAMRTDVQPFADNRVRQAMKLLVDREAMIKTGLQGFGNVGADLFGGWPGGHVNLEYYDGSVKPVHDVEKAKALLKAAGHENLTFTMPVAEGSPGFTSLATAFAQQAKAAGVTVKLQNIPVSEYWTVVPGKYLYRPIQISASTPYTSLAAWYKAFLLSNSPLGETHWGSREHDKAIAVASAATDSDKATELWQSLQQQQANEGGELIFGYPFNIDAVGADVYGVKAGAENWMDNWRFNRAWLKSS